MIDSNAHPLDAFIAELGALRRGGSADDPKPHKLIMLLAVIGLIERGKIDRNQIPFDESLREQFRVEFAEHSGAGDCCQAGPPFFHLRTASFWMHKIKDGRESEYAQIERVGGSTQLITDNIEYAYLREDVFSHLVSPKSRETIKQSLRMLIEKGDALERLGLSFHESFPLVIPAVAQLLQLSLDLPPAIPLDKETIRKGTSLGPNYVRAMPRWAFGSRLYTADRFLSTFGARVSHSDPNLSRRDTLWLMHYHLSAPEGPGPRFWSHLALSILRPGDVLTTNRVAEAIGEWITASNERHLADRTVSDAASVFLGTYARSDSLGPLDILETVDAGKYSVLEPQPPSLWAFAYALADYWQANWGDVPGVNIARVTQADGPGPLLMMGAGTVLKYLGELQTHGFATVQRRTPPFQVNRNWPGPEIFLEQLYA